MTGRSASYVYTDGKTTGERLSWQEMVWGFFLSDDLQLDSNILLCRQPLLQHWLNSLSHITLSYWFRFILSLGGKKSVFRLMLHLIWLQVTLDSYLPNYDGFKGFWLKNGYKQDYKFNIKQNGLKSSQTDRENKNKLKLWFKQCAFTLFSYLRISYDNPTNRNPLNSNEWSGNPQQCNLIWNNHQTLNWNTVMQISSSKSRWVPHKYKGRRDVYTALCVVKAGHVKSVKQT